MTDCQEVHLLRPDPHRAVGRFAYGDSGTQCKDLRMNKETVHVGENSVYREFETRNGPWKRIRDGPNRQRKLDPSRVAIRVRPGGKRRFEYFDGHGALGDSFSPMRCSVPWTELISDAPVSMRTPKIKWVMGCTYGRGVGKMEELPFYPSPSFSSITQHELDRNVYWFVRTLQIGHVYTDIDGRDLGLRILDNSIACSYTNMEFRITRLGDLHLVPSPAPPPPRGKLASAPPRAPPECFANLHVSRSTRRTPIRIWRSRRPASSFHPAPHSVFVPGEDRRDGTHTHSVAVTPGHDPWSRDKGRLPSS
ncbi:hypothetical protein B0H10DRAFT_1956156 [Mycena sp. CBHHK59/15]|nr:hypothetical protein B0H10DRAFT_1956156 [Mycena sp. CBHHK59/15]